MNIGDVARLTGLQPKTIRYYEEIGLVLPKRADNGYRAYGDDDAHRLAFIQRARSLGFTIEECRTLLSLYDDTHRASCDVKALAMEKRAEIDRKLMELQGLRATLTALIDSCAGDDRPQCPIIDDMAGVGR